MFYKSSVICRENNKSFIWRTACSLVDKMVDQMMGKIGNSLGKYLEFVVGINMTFVGVSRTVVEFMVLF